MPSFVPRLEWNDVEVIGDTTSGSPIITNVIDTTEIVEGMTIDHADFPADAVVLSKTVDTITVDADAIGTSAVETFDLFERLTMDYPCPTEEGEEQFKASTQVSSSVSGLQQVQTNFIEGLLVQEYRNLTPTKFNILKYRFFATWAAFGKEFRSFESYEAPTFKTYELDLYDFNPKRAFPKSDDFLYKVSLKFRRVI